MSLSNSVAVALRYRVWLFVTLLGLSAFMACRKQPARFAHEPHLTFECGGPGQPQCLSCTSCHQDIVTERSSRQPAQQTSAPQSSAQQTSQRRHPPGTNCQRCHEGDAEKFEAMLQAPPTPAAKLAGSIAFDHPQHLAMDSMQGQCVSCHGGVTGIAGKPTFPPMSRCFECHEHQKEWDEGVCTPCHRQADLKNLFPRTYLRHGPGWKRQHAIEASNTTVQCAQCHTTESCDDCHNVSQGLMVETRTAHRVEKNFVHPADFITRHAMEAASQPTRCLSCHRTETCDSCHMARGVSANRLGAINPHPPGWTGPDSSAPNHHGSAARRDILSCVSCHDQGPQTNCIECHKVGGPGGNPHPAGWQSSRSPASAMCAYCHEGP